MKLLLAMLALPSFLALAACTDRTPGERAALVEVAVQEIDRLNEEGVNLITAPDEVRALISSACAIAPVTAPDRFEEIRDACAVIRKAAE
ncbi:MAG: hypothetical protein AAGD43_02620 [Pseudomonadota bacterium]